MKPFVTVIIPTYNGTKTLDIAIHSISIQDYPNKEIIVVDDGSTEDIKKIVNHYHVKYFRQKNQGPGSARNLGIKHAKGDYIIFGDDDQKFPKNYVSSIVSGFIRYNVAAVGCYVKPNNNISKWNIFSKLEIWRSKRLHKKILNIEKIGGMDLPMGGTGSIGYKKDILNEFNGFNPSLRTGEDFDLKKRVCDKGYKMLFIPLLIEHYHDYSLKGFLKTIIQRGTGKNINGKKIYFQFIILFPIIFFSISKKILKYKKKENTQSF
jgi:glycosyltransferase involved in cell wall biosynthesis